MIDKDTAKDFVVRHKKLLTIGAAWIVSLLIVGTMCSGPDPAETTNDAGVEDSASGAAIGDGGSADVEGQICTFVRENRTGSGTFANMANLLARDGYATSPEDGLDLVGRAIDAKCPEYSFEFEVSYDVARAYVRAGK